MSQWVNQLKGEFHWHKHDREDEFFYVVDGRFFIDLEGRTVELAHARPSAPSC